ncbi:hypothetical protein BDQ17DRAFT_1369802 [Cyathus striatus]|nr:hypothetical protein BDQ17DRAFT_1369802 [Cyathus striatus]
MPTKAKHVRDNFDCRTQHRKRKGRECSILMSNRHAVAKDGLGFKIGVDRRSCSVHLQTGKVESMFKPRMLSPRCKQVYLRRHCFHVSPRHNTQSYHYINLRTPAWRRVRRIGLVVLSLCLALVPSPTCLTVWQCAPITTSLYARSESLLVLTFWHVFLFKGYYA